MTQQGRLDNITRPNLAGIARSWAAVTPDDSPPIDSEDVGNTGIGCFGLYISREGYVRFITRDQQFNLVSGQNADVYWQNDLAQRFRTNLRLGGVDYPIKWLPTVPDSVRPYFQAGAYLYGEVIHVFAHETTASGIFSLRI